MFVFLPAAAAGFFLLGRIGRRDVAIAWLIGASLLFYGWDNMPVMGLLLFSLIFNYGVGLLLSAEEPGKSDRGSSIPRATSCTPYGPADESAGPNRLGVSRKAILVVGLI
ncbi:MAG: hypothetical protein HZA50_10675, partial [Planctomycetes bacterium]|nr:hypothetical protein [Planctomycetota bacterium]